MKVYGIDLGTTTSISVIDGQISEVFPSNIDKDTKSLCPTQRYDTNVYRSFKTGICSGDTGKLASDCYTILMREVFKDKEEDSALLISVPAMFTPGQRATVEKSALQAGFKKVSIISEPTAAAYYNLKTLRETHPDLNNMAIFDLGGGTFDISIIEYDEKADSFSCKATDGVLLGGDDLDDNLLTYLCSKPPISDLRKIALSRINEIMKLDIQDLKRNIGGARHPQQYKLPRLSEHFEEDISITSEEFLTVVEQTFARCVAMTNKLLAYSQYNTLVLVGGTMKNPLITEYVKQGCSLFTAEVVSVNHEILDKTVALGIQKIIEDGLETVETLNLTQLLYLKGSSGKSVTLIPADQAYPYNRSLNVGISSKSDKMTIVCYEDTLVGVTSQHTKIINLGQVYEPGEARVRLDFTAKSRAEIELRAFIGERELEVC